MNNTDLPKVAQLPLTAEELTYVTNCVSFCHASADKDIITMFRINASIRAAVIINGEEWANEICRKMFKLHTAMSGADKVTYMKDGKELTPEETKELLDG